MLWVSVLISTSIILPIFFWNLKNHFITYTYHQSRVGLFSGSPDMSRLLQQVLGSVFYSNPVNFVIYIMAIYSFLKKRFGNSSYSYPLLLWLSFPLIIVLLLTSLFNETLPHWSGPAYLSLMLFAACWLNDQGKVIRQRLLKTAALFFIVIVIAGTLSIRFLPFTIGNKKEIYLGTGDITLDMNGWKKFAVDFDTLYQSDIRTGRMKAGAAIISDYWFPAGHLDHYIAIPAHLNLITVGPLNNIHHFAWLNERRPRLPLGSDAYFVYPTNSYGPPSMNLRNEFKYVDDSLLVAQWRSGHMVRHFVIFRMHDFRGKDSDYLIPDIK